MVSHNPRLSYWGYFGGTVLRFSMKALEAKYGCLKVMFITHIVM